MFGQHLAYLYEYNRSSYWGCHDFKLRGLECSSQGYHSYMNLLVKTMVWVSPKAGCCSGKYPVQHEGYQCEQLMGGLKIDLKFASKVHFGVKETAISLPSGGQSG